MVSEGHIDKILKKSVCYVFNGSSYCINVFNEFNFIWIALNNRHCPKVIYQQIGHLQLDPLRANQSDFHRKQTLKAHEEESRKGTRIKILFWMTPDSFFFFRYTNHTPHAWKRCSVFPYCDQDSWDDHRTDLMITAAANRFKNQWWDLDINMFWGSADLYCIFRETPTAPSTNDKLLKYILT